MKAKQFLLAALAAGSVAFGAAGVWAHSGATGIVKERMDGMKAMGKAMTVVGDMIKGKAAFDPVKVTQSAEAIAGHASDLVRLFPDTQMSRSGGKTEALPAIWEKNSEFVALAEKLAAQAEDLKSAAVSGDKTSVRVSFARTAKVCSDCHTGFRKPKD